MLICCLLCCFTSTGQLNWGITETDKDDEWKGFLVYTTATVNFRDAPNTDSPIISVLQKGTPLFIEDGSEINGFYPAILIETDRFGYVSSSYVKKDREIKSEHGNLFDTKEYSGNHAPIVQVFNDTDYTISVSIGSKRVSVPKRTQRDIECIAGVFKTIVSAPNVIPFMATDKLEKDYTYSWRFYITRSRR